MKPCTDPKCQQFGVPHFHLPTKEELDDIVSFNNVDGAAFPFLLTHCPRALAALDDLIKRGQQSHGPMDWVLLGVDGNRDRMVEHIKKEAIKARTPIIGDHDDDWLNAVCRAIFVLELRLAAPEFGQKAS